MQKLKLLIAMCFITSIGWAQGITVKGVISDESGGLPGASVVVKGSETGGIIGTVADIEGNYTLDVNANDVLVFSFLGYDIQEVPVDGKVAINVTLQPNAESLEELVVVGYGVQKKASSVAAISQTKGDELLKVGSVTTVTDALQGMMAGVTSISSGTGKPGADGGSILIRGKASWRGNADPLVLVDGVERDMDDVDPNEIENVSVLKDASATAVYGVRGANGVILVTTKRGTVSKPKVSMTANFGLKQPTSNIEYADYVTSMKMWNEAATNDQLWNKLIPESTIDAWENAFATGNTGPYNSTFPQVDWYDQLTKKVGYQQQYNINLRGGTNFVKYFVSLGYLNDGDVFNVPEQENYDPSFNYKRYNWRANMDMNLTKTTVFTANIAGKLGYRRQPRYYVSGGENENGGFYSSLYTTAQNLYPIKWENDEWAVSEIGTGNPYKDFYEGGQRTYKYYQGFLDFKLKQDLSFITKGLSARGAFSYSSESKYQSYIQNDAGGNGNSNIVSYSRTYDYNNPNPDGSIPIATETRWPDPDAINDPLTASYDALISNSFIQNVYYEMAINYAREFGNHDVAALALFSRREKKKQSYDVPIRQEDWVGRVTYGYKDRYLAEFNGSYNGSESFAPGLRFGAFYSGSVGWRISEEPFIKQRIGKYLTNFKVKYSAGTVGFDNGNDRFIYQQSYNSSNPSGGNGVWLGDTQNVNYKPIYTEGDAANADATWEEALKQNLGFEFGVVSKLTGSVDFYTEHRTNILMDVYSPMWVLPPGKSATGNVGETKNHGVDIDLGWNDKIGENVRYWIKGNMSINENRIVNKGDGVNEADHLRDAGKPIGWTSTYINTGYYSSLDDIYNYTTPSTANQNTLIPGDQMYVDYNADGTINGNDKVVTEDVTYPLRTYGLTLGTSYKGWSFHMMFYAVSDISKTIPNMILYDNLNGDNGIYISGPDVTNRWTPETASTATKPSLHTDTNRDYNFLASSYAFQDAAYLRLKNVELSYSFDKQLLKRLKMSKLQLYANGNNLITWTSLDKRLDPEAKSMSVFPMVKRYNFGLRATF